FAAWATGGLETALFGLLVAGGYLATLAGLEGPDTAAAPEGAGAPAPARLGWIVLGALSLGLSSLTRPDGLLVSGSTGVFLLVMVARRRLPARAWLAWAGA